MSPIPREPPVTRATLSLMEKRSLMGRTLYRIHSALTRGPHNLNTFLVFERLEGGPDAEPRDNARSGRRPRAGGLRRVWRLQAHRRHLQRPERGEPEP